MATTKQDPETATYSIHVFTRHSEHCSKRDDSAWKQCRCRKSLYIYEDGRVRYLAARTRLREEAEKLEAAERDKHDPVKMQLKAIADREEAKREKEAEKLRMDEERTVTVDAALAQWLAGIEPKSRSRAVQFQSLTVKLRSWATEQGVTMLADIKPSALNAWHGIWSL